MKLLLMSSFTFYSVPFVILHKVSIMVLTFKEYNFHLLNFCPVCSLALILYTILALQKYNFSVLFTHSYFLLHNPKISHIAKWQFSQELKMCRDFERIENVQRLCKTCLISNRKKVTFLYHVLVECFALVRPYIHHHISF